MPRNENMHRADIQWPLRLWRSVRIAALDEGVTASEWIRRAARERLKRQTPEDTDGQTAK